MHGRDVITETPERALEGGGGNSRVRSSTGNGDPHAREVTMTAFRHLIFTKIGENNELVILHYYLQDNLITDT